MTKLPLRVTVTLWLVLLLTIWNGIRIWTALTWQAVLIKFQVQPMPWVTAITGGAWVIIGTAILWGIGKDRDWTAKLLTTAALAYTSAYWCERLIWQAPHPNWLFTVILNLVLIIFILSTTKLLAREAYERKSQDQKIK
jgi:hypothetical protein